MKKYKLTETTKEVNGHTLHRIKALRDISLECYKSNGRYHIRPGETGGWIESEENLSQEGSCWTYECSVYGGAKVEDDALVDGNAVVKEGAKIGGRAYISTGSMISGKTTITEDVYIKNSTITDLDVTGRKLTGLVEGEIIRIEGRLSEETVINAVKAMTQEERESLYSRIVQEGLI